MAETISHPVCDATSLAVCGDSVAGRALALLLKGVGCAARFVPSEALEDPNPLESIDVIVLTLTPELSAHRRETLTEKLQEVAELRKIPILRLVAASEIRQEGASSQMQYTVSWPCSTEELLQSIEAVQVRSYNRKK